jgi:hypothetical protein
MVYFAVTLLIFWCANVLALEDNSTIVKTTSSPTAGTSLCTADEQQKVFDGVLACITARTTCTTAAGTDNVRKCQCFLNEFECSKGLKICVDVPSPESTSAAQKQAAINACSAATGCTEPQCAAIVDPTSTTAATTTTTTTAPGSTSARTDSSIVSANSVAPICVVGAIAAILLY